jgi:hypothetical protein
MPRRFEILITSVVASVACGAHPGPTSSGAAGAADDGTETTPKTRLQQVQRWAGDDGNVTEAGMSVTGVELFVIHGAGPVPPDAYSGGTLVGVVGGKIVEGRGLVQAAIAAKPPARTLAQIVLWAARREAEILDTPHNDLERRAQVAPPAVVGNALVFWVWTGGKHRLLEVATLDLLSGGLVFEGPASSHD